MGLLHREPQIKDLTIRIDAMDRLGLMDVIDVLKAWRGEPHGPFGTRIDIQARLDMAIDSLAQLLPKVE